MVGEKPSLSFARENSEGNPIYGLGDHPSAYRGKANGPTGNWWAASKIRKNGYRRKEKKKWCV